MRTHALIVRTLLFPAAAYAAFFVTSASLAQCDDPPPCPPEPAVYEVPQTGLRILEGLVIDEGDCYFNRGMDATVAVDKTENQPRFIVAWMSDLKVLDPCPPSVSSWNNHVFAAAFEANSGECLLAPRAMPLPPGLFTELFTWR